jgi:hypothetical protein
MMLNLFFTLSIFIFLIAVVRQLLAVHTFFSYLEEAHPKTYTALGRPRWRIQFGNSVLRDAIKYIHNRGFEALDDPRLEAIYRSIRFAERMAALAAASAMLIALYQAVKSSV